MRNWGLRLLKLLYTGLILSLPVAAIADYTGTQGTGTTFGDAVVGSAHYPFSTASVQTLTGWTTATAGNATQTLYTSSGASSGGWPSLVLQLDQTSTLTGGAVTIEGTYDGTNWVTVPIAQVTNPASVCTPLTNPYTLQPTTNQGFMVQTQGYQAMRIRLSTVITGTATVTPFVALLPVQQFDPALCNPLAAGSATIGNVNLTAGELHVGEIGSNQIKVQVAQTVTAASAYSTGNAIGGLMTVAGAARVSGSLGASGTGGILTGLQMNSKSLQTTQVDVFLFDANPTGSTCTDKTAFSLVVADFDKVVGILTIPGTAANGAGWFGGGTGSVGIPTYFPVTYDLSSATSIYACAVTRGTPTYTATTDVSFKFNFLRD